MSDLEQIVRDRDMFAVCGLKRTQRDELIRQGKFPRPVRISERAKGWILSELRAWQNEKIRQRDAEKRGGGHG